MPAYRIATPAPDRGSLHHSHNVRRMERIETIIEKLIAVRKYTTQPQDLADLEAALVLARGLWDRWQPATQA